MNKGLTDAVLEYKKFLELLNVCLLLTIYLFH